MFHTRAQRAARAANLAKGTPAVVARADGLAEDVVMLTERGLSARDIACRLKISERTVVRMRQRGRMNR